MSSTESKLAEVIQRVFRVTLTDPGADGAAGGDLLYLESLAIELVSEGAEPPFLVTEPLLERALIARLSLTTDALPERWRSDPEHAPFPWLLASFARCDAESRKTRSRDEAFAAAHADCLRQCFEYCVSYSGLLLNPQMAGMFPQPPAFESRGPLQLFDAMKGAGAFERITGEAGGLPSGFLEFLGARFEHEGLEEILGPVLAQLPSLIKGVSPLGETHRPLSLLCQIAASKPCAAAMAKHERWRPDASPSRSAALSRPDGRRFEEDSLLGPFFQCAALPDDPPPNLVGPNGVPIPSRSALLRRPLEPDVRQQCFADLDRRRAGELEASYSAIRGVNKTVREGLYQALYVMLRQGGDVRESVVKWLASACDQNVGRSKMQIDAEVCASHGGAFNVSSVATRLAAPFADPNSGKFRKIDPDYVRSRWCRLDMSETTRVALTDAEAKTNALTEDEEASRGDLGDTNAPAPAPYGFICECFFLTARAMHLGYVKCAAEHTSLAREVQDRARQMEDVDQMRDSWAASIPGGPSQFQMSQFERRVAETKAELERAKSNYAMFEATLLDPETLGEAARFYRLVAAWLRWVAEGRGSGGDGAKKESESVVQNGGGAHGSLLPHPAPVSFAALPEHLVDDLAEFLLYVQRFARRGASKSAVDAELSHCLDDFVNLFVLLLGSPQYVKNPYLRAKFVEILRGWLPGDPADTRYEYVPRYAALFEGGNVLASTFLVPSLLRLYVDIEFTGAANQFYDKFNIRHQIGEMCEYLWRVENHRAAWSALARNDGAFYVRFLNMLINDAIWLLDESMKKLPELREHAADVADVQAWHARPARERQEREAANRQNERALRSDLTLAKVHVGMMGYTSRDIASPFLVPEMVERVASMLNYFLLYLAGPERKQLKFADREKMKALAWDPPEMLGMIVDVYLHLFAADAEGAFVAAIAADGRAYRDEVFIETGAILRQLGSKSESQIASFEALAERARLTHAAAEEEEADLGDVPDHFLDPIMCTLMTDPVLLPSGDNMDRANITRHLLTDETNPFTRQPLKVQDLVSNDALKAEIEAWIAERKKIAGARG